MAGHVIVTLQGVLPARLSLRHQAVHGESHVMPHVGVIILVDGQATTGVLDHEVQQPHLRQLGQVTDNLAGDEMKSAWARLQGELYLLHICCVV